uniref:Putative secreted protein n=1 Tax=Ixodes ricinus TaxID=34613 RepID=A0A6B0UFC2_IXORI
MRQKRVVFVCFSMVRRSAAWALGVIESASSRITILNGGQGLPSGLVAWAVSWEKFLIFSRTTWMPRSSEAFSSRIRDLYMSPKSSRDSARMVDVFPVPGGP